MPRYFLELSYKGTNYSGFQVQENAKTIQSSVEEALQTLYKQRITLTGSSRTDAGVHAEQNFFHFDTDHIITAKQLYNLNALLPNDIAAKAFYRVADDAHSRFGALSREYKYFIYNTKNPFLSDRAWYYPYTIDHSVLHQTAQLVQGHGDFTAFSKRNTQVNNFNCTIEHSRWTTENGCLIYNVQANRFLRGMVRALVSTMLKAARGTISVSQFQLILQSGKQASANFSAPAHGLFLVNVQYPADYLEQIV
jgi:tRNA pseudouridine38-40 synthase